MSAAPAPPEDPAGFQVRSGATDAQMEDMIAYRGLLTTWNEKMNSVGPPALAAFWPRHAWDSAQLLHLRREARTWADLGAGAGFPGVVLAILLKGVPGAKVHLVESQAKRCRFLSEVAAQLHLPVQVHHDRAENLMLDVDIVTARACAPLSRLLGYAEPSLKRGHPALFLKGQDVVSELTEAAKYWKFDAKLLPSSSDPSGRIVELKGLERV